MRLKAPPPVLTTTVDDCSLHSMSVSSKVIDNLRKTVDIQLSKLKEHFNRAVLDLRESVNIVEKENNILKSNYNTLENIVEWSEKSTASHDNLINTNERFLHRNSMHIVGVKYSPSENGIDITRDLFMEITYKDMKIKRSHRDGRRIHGKDT